MEPEGSSPLSQQHSPVPILSQINAIHVLNQFLDFEFNIILPSKPRSLQVFSFPQVSSTKPYMLLSLIRATCIAVSFFFIWSVKFIKHLIISYTLTK